ncbi:uncharacterized protein LOC100679262 isoform X1 [Nasonia vitripennis]|uniref:YDG domain-containing protein n=1 Tax=Nasonia vitripennis TaxID=7425 RepID=A0A7M7GF49_NASVI|nr:uncharacterized protein LOC100679262 isoform X1 [Nasonia vitripennis]
MAKANVETSGLRLRPNTVEENRTVLREIQTRKEVDARKQDELNALFDRINAECASRSLKEKKKLLQQASSAEKLLEKVNTVHYGPLPGFPSGTWWGIRMDCSRDCIHEPFNENIHDGPYGAVSICTSHLNAHNDVDFGDTLTFTSREYSATDHSKDSLILSYQNRVPIRLVRSYCLSNNYAPKTGYRYDGLYTVVDHWIGVSPDTTKHRKFVLTRVLDQESPTWAERISGRVKKSITPRLTRSQKVVKTQEPNAAKFTYKKVEVEPKVGSVSAIVSRQVFNKCIPGSPDSSPKSVSSTDSQSYCHNTCPTKLCNTNLSIRTNLYDSSQKLQDVKKAMTMTLCKIIKPNQTTQLVQKNCQEDVEKINTDSSNTEVMNKNLSNNIQQESTEKKIKKVTWADSCTSTSSCIEKSVPTAGNGFQYSGSDVVDGFSPTSPKKCGVLKYNNVAEITSPPKMPRTRPNILRNSSTRSTSQHVVQIHSRSNVVQTNFSTKSETLSKETEQSENKPSSSSIDSLAPDKLVNMIVKEKYHPMAKLLIGNMIGLENQESAILTAYNTLSSKVDQDDSKTSSKESKLRSFYISNKSRKNGMLKKQQRREIANLIIDAKFDTGTRSSRNRRLRSIRRRLSKSEISQRKLMNARRIQSRPLNNKEIRSTTAREAQPKKPEKRKTEEVVVSKRSKMVSTSTQCTLLKAPAVDQAIQTGIIDISPSESEIKVEFVDLDDIKSEPCDVESNCEDVNIEIGTNPIRRAHFGSSAFAPVNTADSGYRIARLRSIGFRPINSCSPMEDEDSNQASSRPDVDEEYNKYTSEETDIVGYMEEQLHFEDIEDEVIEIDPTEQTSQKRIQKKLCSPKPVESLLEEDFDKPWHGWKQISVDGRVYWSGY